MGASDYLPFSDFTGMSTGRRKGDKNWGKWVERRQIPSLG